MLLKRTSRHKRQWRMPTFQTTFIFHRAIWIDRCRERQMEQEEIKFGSKTWRLMSQEAKASSHKRTKTSSLLAKRTIFKTTSVCRTPMVSQTMQATWFVTHIAVLKIGQNKIPDKPQVMIKSNVRVTMRLASQLTPKRAQSRKSYKTSRSAVRCLRITAAPKLIYEWATLAFKLALQQKTKSWNLLKNGHTALENSMRRKSTIRGYKSRWRD